jgi:type II protein arginine methyltransferase
MVRDAARNAAFQGAIERAVTPDCHVLDIGAGSGLLAMMAARAGAARVHSCEANGAIAAAAARIIAVNGYADRVTLIPRHSTDIDPETDMGGRADLIVSEIVGKDLVAEGVLPALRDAARRLLKPGGRMIPQGGDIVVALGWSSLAADAALGDVCGFDVSAFNQLLPPHHSVLTDDPRIVIRGPDAPLFAFDFTTTAAAATRADLVLCSDGSGPVNGVLQWIRLHMDEQERLENRPGPGAASHWAVQFHPFSSMLDLAAGQGVRIMGAHTHNRLRLWRPDDAVLAG